MNQASFFCPQCQQVKLFQSKPMNHTPHILASVFLCGLWLPIWLLAAASDKPQWHCSFCGFYDAEQYLANPGLRQSESFAKANAAVARQREIEARGDDLSVSDRLGYFVADHKQGLIAVGIICGLVGFMIAGVAFQNRLKQLAPAVQPRPSPTVIVATPTPSPRTRVKQK